MKVSVKIDAKDMNVVGAPAVLEMSVDSEDRTKILVEIDDSGAVEVRPANQGLAAAGPEPRGCVWQYFRSDVWW